MSHLNQHQRQAIEAALHSQRAGLLAQIRSALDEQGQHQFLAVLGQSPGDSSDEALASSLADLSAARIDHEIRQFRDLEAAARRLGETDFGVCVDCGTAIPAGRLLANPAAQRCVACQTLHEKTHAGLAHGSL